MEHVSNRVPLLTYYATFSSLSGQSDTLAPPPSPYPQFTDPSPVDSNGTASTETTEIEDDGDIADDESKELESDLDFESPNRSSGSPLSPGAVVHVTALARTTTLTDFS